METGSNARGDARTDSLPSTSSTPCQGLQKNIAISRHSIRVLYGIVDQISSRLSRDGLVYAHVAH